MNTGSFVLDSDKIKLISHFYDGNTSENYESQISLSSNGIVISGATTANDLLSLNTTGTGNTAVSYTQMADYVSSHGGGGSGTVLNNYLENSDNTMIGDIESLQANGTFAVALGCNSSATAEASIALGEDVLSKGEATVAEGYATTAGSGGSAHAEGEYTLASGAASHSQNIGTIAQSIGQTAIGRYNIANGGTSISTTATSDHAFIIGNGTSANRSNAFSVSWNGNVNASGAVYLGSTATGNAAVSCDQMTDYIGYIPFENTNSLDGTMTVLADQQASPRISGDFIATPANNAYVVPLIVRNDQAAPVFTMENHKDGFYLITGNINLANAGDLFQSASGGAVVV